MDLPVLITVEQETLDSIYAIVFNPLFITGIVALFFLIVYLTITFLERRSEKRKLELEEKLERRVKVRPKPQAAEEELSIADRLKKRGGELKKHEEKFKSGKREELEKRAAELEKRGVDGSKESIEPSAIGGAAEPGRPAAPPSSSRPTASKLDELEKERIKIKGMIDLVEERFHNGEIDKEKFRSLTGEYYNKLLDVDVKIKELT